MIYISKNGATVRLLLTGVVAFFGTVALLLQGSTGFSWTTVFAPVILVKGVIGAAYAIERFMNTSWAQAHSTQPVDLKEYSTLQGTADQLKKLTPAEVGVSDGINPASPAALIPILFKALSPFSQLLSSSYMASLLSSQHRSQANDTTQSIDSSTLAGQHAVLAMGTHLADPQPVDLVTRAADTHQELTQ